MSGAQIRAAGPPAPSESPLTLFESGDSVGGLAPEGLPTSTLYRRLRLDETWLSRSWELRRPGCEVDRTSYREALGSPGRLRCRARPTQGTMVKHITADVVIFRNDRPPCSGWRPRSVESQGSPWACQHPDEVGPRLVQRGPEAKTGKNRLHLDVPGRGGADRRRARQCTRAEAARWRRWAPGACGYCLPTRRTSRVS
jgi:hypothetical protein